MSNAKLTIGLTYIIVPIVCIPCYFSFEIVTHEDSTYAVRDTEIHEETEREPVILLFKHVHYTETARVRRRERKRCRMII